jgi:hypothetical protein
MLRCELAKARALRKLERHQAWLRRNLPSTALHRQCQRELFLLRSDLCVRLGCSGDGIEVRLEPR